MMILGKYSFGTGDRFAHQGKAQLKASILAKEAGIEITPVWNKSHREHKTIKSGPADVRKEADTAVRELRWENNYFVDADHINMSNVDEFIPYSDFFTLDVADYIGDPPEKEMVNDFLRRYSAYTGELNIPGIEQPFYITKAFLEKLAGNFLIAIKEAQNIYKHIEKLKGDGNFITEVSMDEVESPQTPAELFFILAEIAHMGIPAQTIAPKFTGRFNKGVDYAGNINQFAKEFEEDILVISEAVKKFGLPKNLKLSVHSGSDKFSIYEPMNRLIKKHNTGLHIKTAGTTWLEEAIGLAESEGKGLEIAKKIYAQALDRFEELTAPYASVIDINYNTLPSPEDVNKWTGSKFVNTLRHVQSNPDYNPQIRQLIHCGYKVAAELGKEFTDALVEFEPIIEKNVTQNLFKRHILPVFS
jgi:hypothetical protein